MFRLAQLLLILLPGIVVEEQKLGRALCRLEIDSAQISLSSDLRLTMIIEGPAPVEVDVPAPLTKSTDWRLKALVPKSSPLPNGRERWEQTFVLEPYQVGRVSLKLEPIQFRTGNEVLDWPLTWKPLEIRVVTVVKDPDRDAPRSVTGIVELPPIPTRSRWSWYSGLLIVPVAAIVFWLAWRWRRQAARPIVSPTESALLELRLIEEQDGATPEQLPRIADVLRGFLEARFPLAATRQTTSEFLVSLAQVDGLDKKSVELIGEALTRCDLVKFAGVRPDHATCQKLLQEVRDAIARLGQPGATHSTASLNPIR